tara:strand:- start:1857 stop:2240 length:384 start_codon:yes stop_codon:yes gene_type:complete
MSAPNRTLTLWTGTALLPGRKRAESFKIVHSDAHAFARNIVDRFAELVSRESPIEIPLHMVPGTSVMRITSECETAGYRLEHEAGATKALFRVIPECVKIEEHGKDLHFRAILLVSRFEGPSDESLE